MVPILVVLRDGVVYFSKVCKDGEHLQAAFTEEVKGYGVEPCDVDFDNGFIELEDATICMSWAEGGEAPCLNDEELGELRSYLVDIAVAEATRRESNAPSLDDTQAIDLFNKLIDAVNRGTDEVLDHFLNPGELSPADLFVKIKAAEDLLIEEHMATVKRMDIAELEDFFNEKGIPLYPTFFCKGP